MRKNTLFNLFILLLLLLIGAGVLYLVYDNLSNRVTKEEVKTEETKSDEPTGETTQLKLISSKGVTLTLFKPVSQNELNCPLEISGEIPGNWYFEGDFPVELIDEEGNLVSTAIAATIEEWTTTNPVLFKTTFECQLDELEGASIIFKKDNPSGLERNDDQIQLDLETL